MKTVRLLIAAAALGTVLISVHAVPLHAQPAWSVIMGGLDNPRGLTFVRTGDDGDDVGHGWALYVAEAGKGGPGPCAMLLGVFQCVGPTGAVSRYHRGHQERVVTGLPSYAPPETGAGANGPSDVSFAHGRGYVTIGLGGPLSPVETRALIGDSFGWIVRFWPNGRWAFDTDVASYEQEANPGGGTIESNPAGLLKGAGRAILIDTSANALLHISPRRRITTIAIFPSRAQGRSTDAVSDSVARGPDGAYYVGEFTGEPFELGAANVWRVVPGQEPQIYCAGFNFIADLDFDRRGNLYVLEYVSVPFTEPFPVGPGTLYRVGRACSRTPVITGLTNPTSVAIGPDGDAYISNFGTALPGTGEVIRVHLGGGGDHAEDDEEN